MRERVRLQAAQAHTDEATSAPAAQAAVAEVTIAPASVPAAPAPSADRASTKPPRRRRSPWVNPYPDAVAFQTSVYLTNDDLELVKELRLKLHFSREWMVLKYALERLGT